MSRKITEFELSIESVPFGGKGLGHINGKAFFVPNTLPGDIVKVLLTRDKPDFSEGRILQILEPSPLRREPEAGFLLPLRPDAPEILPYSPGYAYFYTDYKTEIKLKNQQFKSFLQRIESLKLRGALKPPFASGATRNYRNKIQLHFQDDHGERKLGYYKADNATVLDLPACPLACEPINVHLMAEREKPGFLHSFNNAMTLTLRHTLNDGVQMWRNNPPKKMPWLKEETLLGRIAVPAGSFFQINPFVGARLIAYVQDMARTLAPDVLIDLFCGVGVFGVAGAPFAKRVIGADADPDGIAAANFNAQSRAYTHVSFECNSADSYFKSLEYEHITSKTLMIVDPPRTGISPLLTRAINDSPLSRLIYISCAPDTLARDLHYLTTRGRFRIEQTFLADMFPRTPHFETVTYLCR